MERTTADYMGMLATVINGLALKTQLEAVGLTARVHTAIRMDAVAEPFIRNRAVHQLSKGDVIVFVAGTGNPFFSTDTTAALRANEIGAEVIFKATKVDGIYTADPKEGSQGETLRADHFPGSTREAPQCDGLHRLQPCMDNKVPIIVFDMAMPRSIQRAVCGEPIGTLVSETP
jgi:uridylate kinase